jgi:L-iditol 2-dehydrogenase
VYLNGAFAEYLLVPERFVRISVHRRPGGLAPEVAACAEPLACVVHGVEMLELRTGSEVLVVGAGPIGLLFVARLAAAGHTVTLIDPHPMRLATGAALGAARTVAARFGEDSAGKLGERLYDASIDAAGLAFASTTLVSCLRAGGTALAFAGLPAETVAVVDLHDLHYRQLALRGVYHFRPRDFAAALELLGHGVVDPRPMLTSERPLERLDDALTAMADRSDLKVVLRP